jgi:hypothetical protein
MVRGRDGKSALAWNNGPAELAVLYKAIKQAPGGERVKLAAIQFDVVTAPDGLTVESAKVRVKTGSLRGAVWETATRSIALGHGRLTALRLWRRAVDDARVVVSIVASTRFRAGAHDVVVLLSWDHAILVSQGAQDVHFCLLLDHGCVDLEDTRCRLWAGVLGGGTILLFLGLGLRAAAAFAFGWVADRVSGAAEGLRCWHKPRPHGAAHEWPSRGVPRGRAALPPVRAT